LERLNNESPQRYCALLRSKAIDGRDRHHLYVYRLRGRRIFFSMIKDQLSFASVGAKAG
jgi:hypothetical protein